MLGFALALGSLLTTGATAGYLAAASMVVGIYTASEQRKRAQRAADAKISDRNVMVREATTDRPHLFGRLRTSGQVQFPGSSGAYSEKMHFALALGDEIDAVEDVWFGDASIGALTADGWTTTGDYYKSRSEPAFKNAVVSSARTITLDHTAAWVTSVQVPIGDASWGTMVLGDPATNTNAYSVATVGGVSVFTFHASQIGVAITINYSHTTGAPKARAKAFLGAAGQAADPYLIAELPTNWSASDKFTSTSYISGTWLADNDVYPTGILDVSAVIRAEKCYDPRTSTTVWTRNPALITWKYIAKRFPNETYDQACLIAAANVCDEEVAIDALTTQARYTFDGSISSETDHKSGLERILQSMVGSACRVAGTWYIWAGAWEAPSMALDEDDLAPGEIIVQGVAEDGVLFNGIGGRYTDPTRWVEDSFPAYVSPAYVALDNNETEILDVDLTDITDVLRVQRVARLMLHKARQALTFACTLEMSAYAVYPGRMVTWTLAKYGWDEKPFRCLKRVYSPSTGTIQCIFQEDAEAIYASSYSELTNVDPAPNTDLPNPLVVEAPVLTFGSGAQFATVLADGSQRPFLRIYWQAFDETVERVELMWRRAHETVWQSAMVDADLRAHDVYGVSGSETYIVQGRSVNGLGVRSEWAVYTVAVDTSAIVNFIGPGMVGTEMIAASAATDVYQYDYTGSAITVGHVSVAGTGGTEILDRILITNDTDVPVTAIITGQAYLTVTGKGQGAYLAIKRQSNSNDVRIDMESPPWNWGHPYASLWPMTDITASETIAATMVTSVSAEIPVNNAIGVVLVAAVADAAIGAAFTSANASQHSLRIEIVKR
ncbi:MAG: hypothetical protein AB7N70_13865 [Dehalococcoidia bacterium]